MSETPCEEPAARPPTRLKACLLLGLFAATLAVVGVVAASAWLTGQVVEDIRRDFGDAPAIRERVGHIQRAAVDWKQTDTRANRFVFRVEGDRGRGTILAVRGGHGPGETPGWVSAELVLAEGEVVPLTVPR